MGRKVKSLVNQRFGMLLVMKHLPTKKTGSANTRARVLVQCDCGTRTIVPKYYLVRKGNPKTHCGCQDSRTTAGGKFAMEHGIWSLMQERCYNPEHPSYLNYGAKGVKVCAGWLKSFDTFLQDIGPRPSPVHTIDRIDPTGNYEPTNVRWATPEVQARNKRRNVRNAGI